MSLAFDFEMDRATGVADTFPPMFNLWGFREEVSDERASTVIVHDRLGEFIDARLAGAIRAGKVTAACAERFNQIVGLFASRSSLLPDLSVSEDECDALWVVGRMSLEISVPEQGPVYVRLTGTDGRELLVGFFSSLPSRRLSHHLRTMTAEADTSNPDWRSLFRDGD